MHSKQSTISPTCDYLCAICHCPAAASVKPGGRG